MTGQETQERARQERIEAERDFHNARYGSGEDTRAHLDKFYVAIGRGDDEYRSLVRRLAAGGTVLEYGCADGTSAILEMRAPAYAQTFYGIDIADESIALATAKAERVGHTNCIFQPMDAEAMTFADDTFDLIYGHGILHHLDLRRCYAQISRTLKPGGTAVFMEPLGHNPLLNWYRNRTPDMRTADEHPLVAGDFDLAREYFASVEAKYYGLTTPLAVPFQKTPLAAFSLSVLNRLDNLLFHSEAIGRQAWYAMMVMTKAG